MALPVGKKEETEDLGGYLSRLIDLVLSYFFIF